MIKFLKFSFFASLIGIALFSPLPAQSEDDLHPSRTWDCWYNPVEVDCFSNDNTCTCVLVVEPLPK